MRPAVELSGSRTRLVEILPQQLDLPRLLLRLCIGSLRPYLEDLRLRSGLLDLALQRVATGNELGCAFARFLKLLG